MIKKIMGIDSSSTTIGLSILELDDATNEIKLIYCDYIKPIKTGEIVERIVNTRDKVKSIIDGYKPDYICVEEIVSYMPKSTNSTVIMLATFNRMVCLLAHDHLKSLYNDDINNYLKLISVLTIRHGLKINKIFPSKEQMPDLVATHLGITFPYVYKKSKKNNLKQIDECLDMADSIAVALYYAFVLSGKIKVKAPKVKSLKKKEKVKK